MGDFGDQQEDEVEGGIVGQERREINFDKGHRETDNFPSQEGRLLLWGKIPERSQGMKNGMTKVEDH